MTVNELGMYDFDRNGTMSFQEFVALNTFLLKVQHAFSDLERGSGFLVPDDVFEALVKIGFMQDSPAFYSVCESFDQSKNGRLRLDDFISLCIFLQSARNLFNSFDAAKQGRVTLDLNQFVYCIEGMSAFKAYKACAPIAWSPNLYITLVTGIPGTRRLHRRTLEALRLGKCNRTVMRWNTPTIRGMLQQVKRLVVIETEEMYLARKQKEEAHRALRPPLVINHQPAVAAGAS